MLFARHYMDLDDFENIVFKNVDVLWGDQTGLEGTTERVYRLTMRMMLNAIKNRTGSEEKMIRAVIVPLPNSTISKLRIIRPVIQNVAAPRLGGFRGLAFDQYITDSVFIPASDTFCVKSCLDHLGFEFDENWLKGHSYLYGYCDTCHLPHLDGEPNDTCIERPISRYPHETEGMSVEDLCSILPNKTKWLLKRDGKVSLYNHTFFNNFSLNNEILQEGEWCMVPLTMFKNANRVIFDISSLSTTHYATSLNHLCALMIKPEMLNHLKVNKNNK